MNTADFTYLLQNPKTITAEQTNNLQNVIGEFPYFQSARAVYLKALKNKESFKYNQELKTTAAYTTDRSILFDFITSTDFVQNEIAQFIKHNTEHLKDIKVIAQDISVNKSVVIDDALKQYIKDTKGVLDAQLFQLKKPPIQPVSFHLDKTQAIEKQTGQNLENQTNTEISALNLGKPLDFTKHEKHSFNEWLKLANLKPIEREKERIEKAHEKRDKKFQLIEKFIKKNPKIDPKQATVETYNIAKAQMIQPESLMTETLARVYIEQKSYEKAIQSYHILSLKYPEKSGFFADQIKAVKQLQEQNSKE